MIDKLKRAFVWLKFHLYQDDFCLFLFFCLILLLLMLAGCKSPKASTETVIRYIDSTIVTYKDSLIEVPVPVERIVDVVPAYDTLKMSTSLANAEAYVDTLTHTLKGSLENKKDAVLTKTVYLPSEERIVYRDSIQKKEVPVKVEVIKTKTPKWAYWTLIGFATSLAFIFRKQVLKLAKYLIALF